MLFITALATATPPSIVSVRCPDAASNTLEYRGCRLSRTHDPTATVTASYNTSTNVTTGFATLDISARAKASPQTAAYAAGLAEGYQTAADLALFYGNVYEFGRRGPSQALVNFVEKNDKWTRQQAEAGAAVYDEYWMAVALVLARFDGTLAGYQKAQSEDPEALPKMTKLDLLWVNLDGDLFDLQRAIGMASNETLVGDDMLIGRGGRAARLFSAQQDPNRVLRCSSLFKRTADDVYFGHATWDTYATAAPRIFKHLTLPVAHSDGTSSLRTISMSSSPGFMSSIDDYYLVGEPTANVNLGVIETSISIEDGSAYSAVTPKSVLCWVRSMAANQVAMDAPSWAKAFATHASGTYNNQWLVIDNTKAEKGLSATNGANALEKDTFWVLEEVPGLVHAEDQTPHLNNKGYWPSFNEIYYPSTRKIAGAHGSYDHAMRYKLFAELEGNVTDPESMRYVMAWNDYQNDPGHIAKGPGDAIMSRGDLGWGGRAGGGIDAKISSVKLAAKGLTSFGRAGPTNDDQPPFCWTDKFDGTPHAGHPHCFDFEWAAFAPMK